jgi:hypothetical protein
MLRKYNETAAGYKATWAMAAEIAAHEPRTSRYWFGGVSDLFDGREGFSRRNPASAGPFEGRK